MRQSSSLFEKCLSFFSWKKLTTSINCYIIWLLPSVALLWTKQFILCLRLDRGRWWWVLSLFGLLVLLISFRLFLINFKFSFWNSWSTHIKSEPIWTTFLKVLKIKEIFLIFICLNLCRNFFVSAYSPIRYNLFAINMQFSAIIRPSIKRVGSRSRSFLVARAFNSKIISVLTKTFIKVWIIKINSLYILSKQEITIWKSIRRVCNIIITFPSYSVRRWTRKKRWTL